MVLHCSTTIYLLLTVLCATVLGQLTINTYPSSVVAGQTYTITYSPKDQPATFILQKGPSTNLGTVGTMGTGTGGSFTWQVPSNLASGADYALQIKQGDSVNFSGQFPVTGGSNGAASSALAPAASSAAASVRSTSTPKSVSSASSQPPPAASSASNPRSSAPTSSSALASVASTIQSAVSSLGTSASSASPTGSSISTSVSASPTSTNTSSGGSNQGSLTTGEKAGIGVGVSIGGLLLALGAFFLGMSARKKTKRDIDTESGSVAGKPELDGKAAYNEKGKPEVESGMIYTELPAHKAIELGGRLDQATATHTELAAEPRGVEIASSQTQEPRHELHGSVAASPVSPISDSQPTGPTRRDTYDDPRLVQNPWAQDDSRNPR